MTFWKDRPEDDGAVHATEDALRRMADATVSDVVRALRRALSEDDRERTRETTLLLSLARHLRADLHEGAWDRLDAPERLQLRRALLTLALLAHAQISVPLA